MLSNFDPWTAPLTNFVVANWLLTLGTSVALLYAYFRARFLFTKPSLLLVSLIHVIFQWPLAIYSGFYEGWLPHPWGIVAVVHGTIVGSLAGSILLFRPTARQLWSSVASISENGMTASDNARLRVAAHFLFGLTATLGTLYFFYVPADCTGIYALIRNPDQFYLAREISLKLLADNVPRYAVTFIMTTTAPLLSAVVALMLMNRNWKISPREVGFLALVLVAWALASINGAKANLVYIGLAIVALTLWRRELRIHLIRLPFMLGLALLPAIVVILIINASPFKGETHDLGSCFSRIDLTVARQADVTGATTSSASIAPESAQVELAKKLAEIEAKIKPTTNYATRYLRVGFAAVSYYTKLVFRLTGSILYRSIVVPFQVGTWYIHYAQTQGSFGLGAVPRLAHWFGYESIDAPNRIGLVYGPQYEGHAVPPHISASAGFVFTYSSYFGYWAIALNIFLVLALDFALLALVRIDRILLLPTLAALSVAALKFAESDYTTVWITHGFGPILVVNLVATYVMRQGWRPRDGKSDA
jgi:hypothetical protein